MKLKNIIFGTMVSLGMISFVSSPVLATNVKNAKTNLVDKKKKEAKTASKKKTQEQAKNDQKSIKSLATYSKLSYVVVNKNTNFINGQNKNTKSIAKKGKGYRIYYVRYSGSKIFYGVSKNKWLPASVTHGTVWYKEDNNNTMILSTNKKGQLSYQLYEAVNIIDLILKRNSYVYDDQGMLERNKDNSIIVLKKGKKLKGYSVRNVNGKKFYITNHGWIKFNNVEKYTSKKSKK